MPGTEKHLVRKIRVTKLRTALLSTIALAGVVAIGIALPNTLQLLEKPLTKASKRNTLIAIKTLVRKGYLSQAVDGTLSISKKGERVLKTIDVGQFKIRPASRWDGRWRIVMFDIPQRRTLLRKSLVLNLRSLGFIRLQDSVWVFPYDCEEFVTLLKRHYSLGTEVLYVIAERFENDHVLRTRFELTRS